MKKLSVRVMAAAMCGVIAAASIIGVSASAYYNQPVNDRYIIPGFEQYDSGIMPYAATKISLEMNVHGQEKTNWCWAASMQSVLDFYKVNKTQSEIVKKVKGSEDNETSDSAEIAAGLNAFYPDGKFTNVTSSKSITFTYIKNKLAVGKPVILTGKLYDNQSHAVVCYGYDTSGGKYELYIIDPAANENKGNRGILKASSSTATSYDMQVVGQPSDSYSTTSYVASTASTS